MVESRILVVDDEEDLCEILRFNLQSEGYRVDVSHSAEEAFLRDLSVYDLILLDVMMGRMSGYEMAIRLKQEARTAEIPIIFLTARDAESDRLRGFDVGADDYVSKPFSIKEVMMRAKVALRRSRPKPVKEELDAPNTLVFGALCLDMEKKLCSIDGAEVQLTRREFELLSLFLSRVDSIISREVLMERIWPDDVLVLDRTIDVNIARLRKKIGEYGSHLVARSGFGYCFKGTLKSSLQELG